MHHRNKIILVLLCFACTFANAQNKNIFFQMKSGIKRADIFFERRAYQQAIQLYKQALNKQKHHDHAVLRLAEAYRQLNHTKEAEEWYRTANLDSSLAGHHHLHYAELLLSNGKLLEASKWFDLYTDTLHQDRVINKKYAIKDYALFYSDSAAYKLFNLSINTNEPELFPAFYQGGIVFASSRKRYTPIKYENSHHGSTFLNLYHSKFISDTSLSNPTLFKVLQHYLHEGPIYFYENDNKAYFSLNNIDTLAPKNTQHLGLFYAEKNRLTNKWITKNKFTFNSGLYSISHPFFNKKASILYFVSDMPGGKGGTDIYTSKYENGIWKTPVNLTAINTSGNEMFPFINEDNELYFSSNGHPGMGGLDILRFTSNDSIPENVGYPINSAKDDFGLIIAPDGKSGFFCSNRKNGNLDDDIYGVKFYGSTIEFTVKDRLKGNYIKNIRVKITDLQTNKSIIVTNGSGHVISFKAKPNKKYRADFIKKDYKIERVEFEDNLLKGLQREVVFLEKSHKSYIKGKVTKGKKIFANCNIKILDFHADTIESLLANAKGEFRCQINDDTTNLFLAERDSLIGLYKFEPHHKKAGTYGMTYITIEMEEVDTKFLTGSLVDSTGLKMPNYPLYLKNQLTNEVKNFYTDPFGDFKIEVWQLGKYAILSKKDLYFQTLHSIFAFAKNNIIVTLKY